MNIAMYLRLSMADGDLDQGDKEESNSIENQRLLLITYIEKNEELTGDITEYVDDGYTGTNFDRPGFTNMVEDAKKGKIQVIVCKDLSRLGRDYIGVGDYLEQIFPALGVRVIAINSFYDSASHVGDTIGLDVSITNLINTLYSRDLSKKFRSAIQTKWKNGQSTYGRVPFGYLKDENKKWIVDPVAGEYVKMIFAKAVEGYTTKMIVDFLNEEGVPTPGKYRELRSDKAWYSQKVYDKELLWDISKVHNILKNYCYTGALVSGKHRRIAVGKPNTRKVKESERFVVEDVHEALVSKEDFEAAQEIYKFRTNISHRGDSGYSLKGKVRCDNCNLLMTYQYNAEPVLCCMHGVNSGKSSTCNTTRYSAGRIETIALYEINRYVGILNLLGKQVQEKQSKRGSDFATKIKKITGEISTIKAEKIRQYEAYANGTIDRELYLKNKKRLTARQEDLQKIYDQCCDARCEDEKMSADFEGMQNKTGKGKFKKMTRKLADIFIEEIRMVDDGHIIVNFKFDDLIERASKYLEEDDPICQEEILQ